MRAAVEMTRCGLECNGMIEGKWRDERWTMRDEGGEIDD
jgi:hypothetical protein